MVALSPLRVKHSEVELSPLVVVHDVNCTWCGSGSADNSNGCVMAEHLWVVVLVMG